MDDNTPPEVKALIDDVMKLAEKPEKFQKNIPHKWRYKQNENSFQPIPTQAI